MHNKTYGAKINNKIIPFCLLPVITVLQISDEKWEQIAKERRSNCLQKSENAQPAS